MPRDNGQRSCFTVGLIAVGAWAALLLSWPVLSAVADEGSVDPAPNEETLGAVLIYCILDPLAVGGSGHTGVIVDDGTLYWYYSFGLWGFIEEDFHTLEEAFAYAKADDPHNHYRMEAHWYITASQAARARRVARFYAQQRYNLLTNNCWHMAYRVIHSAVGNWRIVFFTYVPLHNFMFNALLADGYSRL